MNVTVRVAQGGVRVLTQRNATTRLAAPASVDTMSHPVSPLEGRLARVWIVDDSPLEAAIVRRALGDLEIEVFHDANAMLERMATERRPDVLILDWNMPGTSGVEACRLVRETIDRLALPILFLTASDRREDLEEGLAAGANDFVRKPFETAELLARVASLIEIKHLHERLVRTEATLRDEAGFREQFLAILAHDLRQPLNVFALACDLLAAATTPPELRQHVATKMARATARMQRMIGELLDFSRSRPAKGMPIAPRTTDLGLVAREVIEEIRLAHPTRQIVLSVVGPCEGSWDPDRLAQVVSNLVENAVANSPPDSSVSFTVSARGGRIELAVENGGPTIAPGDLATLFEAFRQPKASRSGGLGLGLYIVAEIVRAHGGTIKAESDAGRTRFEVSLPMSTPSAA